MRAVALVGVAALISGCEVAVGPAPDLEPRVVVHAVLDPYVTPLLVHVEETRRSGSGVPNEPGGPPAPRVPITDARVTILGPGDQSVEALQDGALPAGVYTVRTRLARAPGPQEPGVLLIVPGERYRLRVETPLGVVAGETTIPLVSGDPDRQRRAFNVDRDTLRLAAPPAGAIGGYFLRHDTRQFRHERYRAGLGEALLLPPPLVESEGAEGWAFSFSRSVIRPGSTQSFSVVAVDSNYFRYYVAGFDPFGDDTRGNTLTGGVGLFGSVILMMAKPLDLIADIDTPIEGTWDATRNSFNLPLSITLYESPRFPGNSIGPNGALPIAGRATMLGAQAREALAGVEGTAVSMFFTDPSGGSVLISASGQLGAGTLTLTESRTGERVTYRRR